MKPGIKFTFQDLFPDKTEMDLLDEMVRIAVGDIEQKIAPMTFRDSDLKKFLNDLLLEKHPNVQIAQSSLDFFAVIFQRFIIDKVSFELWKIRND